MENSPSTEERKNELKQNLETIQAKIEESIKNRSTDLPSSPVTLIAVSKTKPASDIQILYDLGQRDFGENYIKELVEKSASLPKDINWHYIGRIQSNKVNKLVIPELKCVQTVDSVKIAGKIDKKLGEKGFDKLGVFVQVNTDEEKESGVEEEDSLKTLVGFVLQECENLNFKGLMTIGAYGDDTVFEKMIKIRKEISTEFEIDEVTIELSMGMSADFQEAIEQGSSCVRVGSSIFGSRNYN